jgi:hypothetical protein
MRPQTASGITLHADNPARGGRPAINVKCRTWPRVREIGAVLYPGRATLTITEQDAIERASGFAYDSAVELFWEDVGNLIQEHFPYLAGNRRRGWEREGRQGGWLVLDLPDPDDWDDDTMARWQALERDVMADITARSDPAAIAEDIRANDWLKPHSNRYNFITTNKGDFCLADIRADAETYIRAKYGAGLSVLYPDRD